MDKKTFSTFSYKLVQISPIMILVNSGAFLSISSWYSELTELIFVMIPYISSTGYPSKTQGIMGHVQVANRPNFDILKIKLNTIHLGTLTFWLTCIIRTTFYNPL